MTRPTYLVLNKVLPLFEPKTQTTTPLKRVLWVIGAPRSGTTLTYQLLAQNFSISYMTNWVGNLYRAPLVASSLQELLPRNTSLSFDSTFGRTSGIWGPHEGGQFLYKFFPVTPQFLPENYWDIYPEKRHTFTREISFLGRSSSSFLLKNTVNALRISALYEAFPQSVFIWVERDLLSNVYSILKARQKTGSISDWWGVQPQGFEDQQNKTPIEQVIWQVRETQRTIEQSLFQFGAPFIRVQYSSLCTNPERFLTQVEHETGLKRHQKASLSPLAVSTPPEDALSLEIKHVIRSIG